MDITDEMRRHSAAHLTARAIMGLFDNVQVDIGPATDEGFYYDFDLEHRLSPDDFPKIEAEIARLIALDEPFVQKDVTAEPGTKFSFKVTGYDGQPVYAFHWNAETENWDYVDKGTAASFDITFPDLSPIGLVVELPESGEDTPKTGDNSNITLWAAVLVVAAAGAAGTILYSKKRKNEA